jgi:hypothetical protein
VFSPGWVGELRVTRALTRGRWSTTPVEDRVVFRRLSEETEVDERPEVEVDGAAGDDRR